MSIDKILEVGLIPLVKLGFVRFGQLIVRLIGILVRLLLGKREGTETETVSGSLYVGSSVLSVLGTIALVYISFSGSFAAASDFAYKNGIDLSVAHYIPIAVDGLIVLCIVALFTASLGGYKATWLSFVVLFFTGLSIYFNVSHIGEGVSQVDRYLLGATFPVIVFLASESTKWQIEKAVAFVQSLKTYQELRSDVAKLTIQQGELNQSVGDLEETTQTLTEQIIDYKTTVDSLELDLSVLAASADATEENKDVILRRVAILRAKHSNPTLSQTQLAEMLNTSQKTISRDINAMNGIYQGLVK